jgi:hypothetical protein
MVSLSNYDYPLISSYFFSADTIIRRDESE